MSKKQHSQRSASLGGVLIKYENLLERTFFASSTNIFMSYEQRQKGLVVELDFNFSIEEVFQFFKIFQENLLIPKKAFDSIQHFQKLMYKLENDYRLEAGITEISLYFKKTAIHLHSITECCALVENLTGILKALIHHYVYFSKSMKSIPSDIHIPVLEFDDNPETLSAMKCQGLHFSPYMKYWGLYFDGVQKSQIYHVPTNNFVMGQLEYED
ncbi:MAG: hypothetical protein ED555_01135 [Allomuricauda sp.]|nr:MAG: hypothetical protein ED555_01135 [Allomuricauda sp.]